MQRIENVSYIVIALNEEAVIGKCLSSIASGSLSDCQVIFVDSNSADRTVDIAKSFTEKVENMEIYRVKGTVNAAIARNVGISAARKKYVFFIDGDTEISNEFVNEAVRLMESTGCSAVKGSLKECQYTASYDELTKVTYRSSYKKITDAYHSGGTFVARRDSVTRTGTFNEHMRSSEDHDFTLRLTKHERMLAIPTVMGVHHTVPYRSRSLAWCRSNIKAGMDLGRLLRYNWSSFKGIISLSRLYRGLILGIVFYTLLVYALISPSPTLLWVLFSLLAADVISGIFTGARSSIVRWTVHYIQPVFCLIGLLATRKKNPVYFTEKLYP